MRIFLLIALLALAGWAQPPADPEEIGCVQRLEAGVIHPLEGVRATYERRSGLFSGVQSVLILPGEKSTVRLPGAAPLDFVVRTLPLVQDPNRWELLKLEKDGSERLLILYDVGVFELRGSEGVLVLVRPYGPSSFRLTTTAPLPPGEYAFHYGSCERGSSQNLFTFGVDK